MAEATKATLGGIVGVASDRSDNVKSLQALGGVHGVAKLLKVKASTGLASLQIEQQRQLFGSNQLAEPESDTWLQLFWAVFEDDVTVWILMASAIVSLTVGILENPKTGWIEGAAILAAVLIVAVVTATNDFQSQAQFAKLNAQEKNIAVKVVRDGKVSEVSTNDLVVGDVLVLEQGDKIPADALMLQGDNVKCSESALTGENDDLSKDPAKDAFFFSGCQVVSGSCRALVYLVGEDSQWGKLKAAVENKDESKTPLQLKLDDLAGQIGNLGTVAAALTFLASISVWYLDQPAGDLNWDGFFKAALKAFIMAVTIVVVAVPEGLPLAVTISLAYSTQQMLKDMNLVRVMAACETMGNATAICSDKTGTLTQNLMTVVVASSDAGDFQRGDDCTGYGASLDKLAPAVVDQIALNTTAELAPPQMPEGSAQPAPANPLEMAAAMDRDQRLRPTVVGNKTEGALLLFLLRMRLDKRQSAYDERRDEAHRLGQVMARRTFDSKNKFMSVLTKPAADHFVVLVKGASEIVLARCGYLQKVSGAVVKLEPSDRDVLAAKIAAYARQSLRTIILAHRVVTKSDGAAYKAAVTHSDDLDWDASGLDASGTLVFDMLVGIEDPLRPGVKDAVVKCQGAGITVRMVTGDNEVTAQAIARQCAILQPEECNVEGTVLTGKAFRTKFDAEIALVNAASEAAKQGGSGTDEEKDGDDAPVEQAQLVELPQRVQDELRRLRVLARSSPQDKLSLVRLFKNMGEVVGVTGDGINDAPALASANVGLAMNVCGTDVAKDASDIIIMDDNFASIVNTVKWGRCVFDNIRRFLQFQLTVNVVALTVTFLGALLDFGTPLNAVMMLWVNLIMDTMGALALATEKPTPDLFQRKPYSRDESLISPTMWRNVLVQSAFQLSLFAWLLSGALSSVLHVPEDDEVRRNTVLFNTFVACQLFNELNARSISNDINVLRGVLSNRWFVAVIIFTVVAQFLIVTFGGDFTRTCPLTPEEWAVTTGLGALALPVGVLMRLLPVFGGKPNPTIAVKASPVSLGDWLVSALLAFVPGVLLGGLLIGVYHRLA